MERGSRTEHLRPPADDERAFTKALREPYASRAVAHVAGFSPPRVHSALASRSLPLHETPAARSRPSMALIDSRRVAFLYPALARSPHLQTVPGTLTSPSLMCFACARKRLVYLRG
jgi:hypothetical protein